MKSHYTIARRTALDGKSYWTCYYINCNRELDSIGRFTTKKAAEYFKARYLTR